MAWNAVKAVAGLPWQRRLAQAALTVSRVRTWERKLDGLSDEELRLAGLRLRGRARGGEDLDRLLPEAFALVCIASRRRLGMSPYDVQIAAGAVLHHAALAE